MFSVLCNCLSGKHKAQFSKVEANKDSFAFGLSVPTAQTHSPLWSPLRAWFTLPPPFGAWRRPPGVSCPSASPHVCWGAVPRLGQHPGCSGVSAQVRENLVPGWARVTSLSPSAHGGKSCALGVCVCLQAAVAIAWPLALIILMAFHTPGKSLRTLLLGTGCCWLGNWDAAPGNLTGSFHKMKLSRGWDLN